MKKRNALQFLIAATLLLTTIFCSGQDTTKVIMLVGDTAHVFDEHYEAKQCPDSLKNTYCLCGDLVKVDKGNYGRGQCSWVTGYIVYTGSWYNRSSRTYYDKNWKQLPSTCVVWDTKIIK